MHDPKYESVIATGVCEGRNLSAISASCLSRWFVLPWHRRSSLPRPWRGRHFASQSAGAPSFAPFAKGGFLRCCLSSLSSSSCSLPLFHSFITSFHFTVHSPFATPHSPMTL